MNLKRRDFIKLSLATGAAATIGVSLTKPLEGGQLVDKWVKGACRFCGTGCGVYVGVKKGKNGCNKR